MTDLLLAGCAPVPLMAYLKALGILRLVCESPKGDLHARGAWRRDGFTLQSRLDIDALFDFFLEEYEPTPIVGPWAGGSGFFGKDNREAVDAIAASTTTRLRVYRRVIADVRAILLAEGQLEKPADEAKNRLLRKYRQDLPDEFVTWIDAALVLQDEGQTFPPLLGTGGNDGRLDFTQNFMQRLVEVGMTRTQQDDQSRSWLRQSLKGDPVMGLKSVAVGQFDPGRAGGPNATQGMEGDSLVNPWDFILMIEGALLLGGSATRRLGSLGGSRASFPFTVRPSSVGFGSSAEKEGTSSRGEIWLPVWHGLAAYNELRELFSEGRADVTRRPARNGVDFARAVAGIGVDRGIARFERYGFLRRSGKSYVAAPLGGFDVAPNRDGVELLGDLDKGDWLDRFRRACQADDAPPRFAAIARRIDTAIFEFCRFGGNVQLGEVLRGLGQAERELASGERFRKNDKRTIHSVPSLSPGWISSCDDGSPEFRLAKSLAFMRNHPAVNDLRANMEPVERKNDRWIWAESGPGVVWTGGNLARDLSAILTRRLMDANRKRVADIPLGSERPDGSIAPARRDAADLPLASEHPASDRDIAAFLNDETDDRKIAELLWGLILVQSTGNVNSGDSSSMPQGHQVLSRAYAMLKLLFLPFRLTPSNNSEPIPIRPEPEILGRLRAGRIDDALVIASRRLRASGLIPMPGTKRSGTTHGPEFPGTLDPTRLAASLLFPVSKHLAEELAKLVLRPQTDSVPNPR
jgi:CRISPR-associated protein Csx17